MGKLIDLTGQRFGRLTVIERAGADSHRQMLWKCVCDCGNETIVRGHALREREICSCGCFRKERSRTHGLTGTRLYRIWRNMKSRCLNKNNPSYKDYGGRGIGICDEWRETFIKFYKWAMVNGYEDSLSIDRINNNKGYSPDNCRWTEQSRQNDNKRNTRRLTYNGEIKTITEWAEELKIERALICDRLAKGWTIEETLTIPKGQRRSDKNST